MRVRIFNIVVVPVLKYGYDARVMTERDKGKIQVVEMKFMRSTLGSTILDRKNVDIRTELGVNQLLEQLRSYKRRWYYDI